MSIAAKTKKVYKHIKKPMSIPAKTQKIKKPMSTAPKTKKVYTHQKTHEHSSKNTKRSETP